MSDLEIEREIPVLTVWKNNSILKNIFLINNNNQEIDHNEAEICPDFEESLLVGRHPDCDIRLEHPSISRFHLRIHSFSSSKRLFLTDLSSVHGTWVSGRRIEPNIRTIVKEGDHLRIGGSSRVYKFHWIPLSQAYDMSKPFVPPLDLPGIQEDEDEVIENEISVELKDEYLHNVDDISKDISKGLESLELGGGHQMVSDELQKPLLVKDEATEFADIDFEGLDSLCLDDISQEVEQNEILVEPPACNDDVEIEDVQSVNSILEGSVPLNMGDISRELGQKEMFFAPPILNEEFQKEDVQSVDSILEGLVPLFIVENWEWIGLEQNCLPCPTEEHHALQSKDDKTSLVLEGLDPLFLDANPDLLAPLMPKEMEFPAAENIDNIATEERQEFALEIREEYVPDFALHSKDDGIGLVQEGLDTLFLDANSELLSKDDEISQVLEGSDPLFLDTNSELLAPLMPKEMEFPIAENIDSITAEERQEFVPEILGENVLDNAWSFWCGSLVTPSSPPTLGTLLTTECHHGGIEDENPDHESEVEVLIKKKRLVSFSSDRTSSSVKELQEIELWNFWSGKMGVESECSALSDVECFSESENKSLSNGYLSSPLGSLILSEQKSTRGFGSGREKLGSGFSLSDAESFAESENESCGECYQSPKPLNSVKERFGSPPIWPKSDQRDSVSRSLFHEENNQEDEIFTPDKENITPIIWSRAEENKLKIDQKSDKNESISRILFHGKTNRNEEEIFTPGKENFTPTTHKSMRKLTVLKDISNLNPGKSSLLKMSCRPNNCYEGTVSPLSEKENYSTGTQQKQKTARRGSANKVQSVKLKERKGDRTPFQSLLASPQKSITERNIADNEMNSGIYVFTSKGQCVRKEHQQWNMVVDTSTLLNKESRRALQLLEGLKGTQLIIPRIVLMELASLKQQVSFFRRNTEVLSALEWIQDCMLRTRWWIHVQNSAEDDGSYASFSDFESQMEVVSPTVEDNVIDFALSLSKTNHDGQLILLSNHVTMMIKAMALGMICETGEQFRGSLVNPFSERFRWADSSPRGQTWSCADDFVLKKKFYPSSLMTPKSMENLKGLKLIILLHHSRYQERVTAIH